MGKILNNLVITLIFLLASSASAREAVTDLQTVTLAVENMSCPMCKITIRKALEKVDGVQRATVDYDSKIATVTFDATKVEVNDLTSATGNGGYPSTQQTR